jgi:nickel transport system ATP-binding protein
LFLQAENITVSFRKENQKRLFGRERQQVLKNVSLELRDGECLALVGESGSGKSTLGRVLSALLKPNDGKVLIDGVDMYANSNKHGLRKISIVFQDYTTSVNPRFRVRDILAEPIRVLKLSGEPCSNVRARTAELLEQVGLSEDYGARYPHELSGGQLQRVCIARAVATKPEMILLDEAISSLDASTQTQVMDLLIRLRREHGFSYFFITHDLMAVTYMCDKVIFLHEGKITERVDGTRELPFVKDDYAKKLLASVVLLDRAAGRRDNSPSLEGCP